MSSLWGERFTGFAAVAAGTGLAAVALDFPAGGALFPLLISAALGATGLAMIARTIISPGEFTAKLALPRSWDEYRPLVVLLACLGYVLVMPAAGYVAATVLFLTGVPLVNGLRRPAAVLIGALTCLLFVHVLFEWILRAGLPTGSWM